MPQCDSSLNGNSYQSHSPPIVKIGLLPLDLLDSQSSAPSPPQEENPSCSLSLSSLSQTLSDAESSDTGASPRVVSDGDSALLAAMTGLVETSNQSEIPSKTVLSPTSPNLCKELCSISQLANWARTTRLLPPLHLGNSGNSCYVNSVLQCLLATPELLGYCQEKHSDPLSCPVLTSSSEGDVSIPRFCALCELDRLIKLQRTSREVVWPTRYMRNIKSISTTLSYHNQEDAHEFFLCLLTKMEENCLEGFLKWPPLIRETNAIRRIFGGVLTSQVTCQVCRKTSSRDEHMFNLSLDITCGNHLLQCLHNYTKVEELKGANEYKCETCCCLQPAHKRSTISVNSRVLVIQLNRFSRNQKIDTSVAFPLSLNLRPYMTPPEDQGPPLSYSLFATVNHRGGSCRSGHYISFCRRQSSWQCLNDDMVRNVTVADVQKGLPYLLFFELNDHPHTSAGSTSLHGSVSSGQLNTLPSRSSKVMQSCGIAAQLKPTSASPNFKPRIIYHKMAAQASYQSSSNGSSYDGPSTSGINNRTSKNGHSALSTSSLSYSNCSSGSNGRKFVSKRPGERNTVKLTLPKICLKRVHSDTWASKLKDSNVPSLPNDSKSLEPTSTRKKSRPTPPQTNQAPPQPTTLTSILTDYPITDDEEEGEEQSEPPVDAVTSPSTADTSTTNHLPAVDDYDDDWDEDDRPLTIDLNPSECVETPVAVATALFPVNKEPDPPTLAESMDVSAITRCFDSNLEEETTTPLVSKELVVNPPPSPLTATPAPSPPHVPPTPPLTAPETQSDEEGALSDSSSDTNDPQVGCQNSEDVKDKNHSHSNGHNGSQPRQHDDRQYSRHRSRDRGHHRDSSCHRNRDSYHHSYHHHSQHSSHSSKNRQHSSSTYRRRSSPSSYKSSHHGDHYRSRDQGRRSHDRDRTSYYHNSNTVSSSSSRDFYSGRKKSDVIDSCLIGPQRAK